MVRHLSLPQLQIVLFLQYAFWFELVSWSVNGSLYALVKKACVCIC